ncbi:MAG TPA: ABC transporter ATP-binding protein [Candidatus Sulfomarinibacteraceae bacterium]|nr:ABC transporter ATP-binding protein [Candidatus Sulfomarinibacteraceae bacterium]
MTQPAIAASNLTYSYGDNLAVDHISFDVAHGEVFGFLGPNGAGKSTTIMLLTGQLTPSEGSAMLLGMDVVRQRKQVQAKIGISFENTNLYEQMSAVENLNLFARLYGVQGFDAMDLLQKVGLAGREKERVAGYSKGMKQRLMLARAMVSTPQILFLDEPTEGLDPVSSQTIHALIRDAVDQGTTVLLTTHDMVEADKLSDRVAFINKGQIVALDTPARLKRQYGQRALKIEVELPNGDTELREVALDGDQTAQAIYDLFQKERVVTVHSEEATLEDIFIDITGRGLQG